jgi:CRP/FNR family transcriptional regulator
MCDKVFAMEKREFIQTFPVFKNSPEALLRVLLSAGRRQVLSAGKRIYSEGDSCSAIALVLSGEIRVYKIGQSGREITLYEIGPGETCILNASCILAGQGYPAYAATVEETDLLLVPSAEFRRMVSVHEQMREFVFTLLSKRLSGVMELVEEVAFGRMDERLAEYLMERSSDGRLETTHQKIANDLGTSREVVSRLLKDLEHKGKVRLSRNEILLISGGWI